MMKEMLLYDVQDLKPTVFDIKEKRTQPTLAGNKSDTSRTVVPSNIIISNANDVVNQKVSISSQEELGPVRQVDEKLEAGKMWE